MNTRAFPILRLVSFVLLGVVLAVLVHFGGFLLRTPSSTREYKEILIQPGSSYRAAATLLEDKGIITNKEYFILLGRLMGVDKSIRAGFYSLNTAMRPMQVLDIIGSGRIIEYQVVFPEGHTIQKAAEILDAAGLVNKYDFLKLATDPKYVRSLGLDADTLEGYLFPATYYFPKGITADGIIRRLVSKYREVMNDDLKARAAQLGMTEHQVVTLASLIEREAMIDSERQLISAVFHNRLKRGMPLQCDPTVIYALQRKGIWNGNLTRADLRMKDPYNTYVHTGLPPGPIANPGKPSIIAALYPADVNYIFFVSRGDGTHYFSTNLADHNRAVYEYQVLRAGALKNHTTPEHAPWTARADAAKPEHDSPAEAGEPQGQGK
jgi:peptidoglycan lytic transglycosylase G